MPKSKSVIFAQVSLRPSLGDGAPRLQPDARF